MKIYLIGMPGSGKTTLGKQLADELDLPFIDLDEEIVRHEGKTIPEVFANEGETYFRTIESELLKSLAGSAQDFVMATGGGAPCFYDGIQVINANGISIFLDVPIDELLERVSNKKGRPLFDASTALELREKISLLMQTRRPVYVQATITTVQPTLRSILKLLDLKK
jgi:shikimate kinase